MDSHRTVTLRDKLKRFKIDLDPFEASKNKEFRRYRLNAIQIPRLRLMGFAGMCLILMLHNIFLIESFSLYRFCSFTTIIISYALISWLILYFFFNKVKVIDLSQFFLTTDIFIFILIIYLSGGEKSWLFFLLMVRVADQANTTFKKVLYYSHISIISYILLLLYLAFVEQRTLVWSIEFFKIFLIYCTNFYISLTAKTAEKLRRGASESIKMAKGELVRRKKIENALRENETKYRQIVDHAPTGIYEVDIPNAKMVSVNDIMCEYTGYTKEEFLQLKPFDLLTEESLKRFLDRQQRSLNGEKIPEAVEYKVKDKNGREFWALLNSKITYQDGVPLKATVVAHDITERKQAEESMLKSEERYRIVSELTSDFSYAFRVDANSTLKFEWVTGAFARITGFSADELSSVDLWETLIHPDDKKIAENQLKILLSGKSKVSEYRILNKKGEIRWLRDHGYPVWNDEQGRVVQIYGAVKDITERKNSRAALRKSEEKYKTLTNNLHVGIYRNTIGSEGKFLEANPAIVQMFGYQSRDEFLSIRVADLYQNPKARKKFSEKMLRNGVVINEELQLKRKDGTAFIGSVSTVAVKNKNGEVKYYDGVIEDITKRKQIETQLQHAQRMEAIGTLAGGIAHDFNNILSAVIGYTEMSLNDGDDLSTLKSNMQEVLIAGNRAKDLVKQILTFSRQSENEVKPIQVDLIVKEALKLLRASLPTTIEIKHNIKSDAAVFADPTQIHQILMNLCTNAEHAMRKTGGILEVSLTEKEFNSESMDNKFVIASGKYMCLRVSDTGKGMEPYILDRIFDPFFTTKSRDEGTGMGLAVVHGIVKSYGGEIYVQSQPGEGSVFKVFLPKVESEIKTDTQTDGKIPTGTERILFVDDEKPLVDLGQQMLERLGYQVSSRTSSVEALELFKTLPNRFDLVITDMTMPNMTGEKLTEELLKIRSDIPIILCTGYSQQLTEQRAREIGIQEYVLKPISVNDMAKSIRNVLGN